MGISHTFYERIYVDRKGWVLIANAVYNATGKRFYELPITAEKILNAIDKYLNKKTEYNERL